MKMLGSNLRRTRGEEFYTSQVELIADYLIPQLLRLWLKSGNHTSSASWTTWQVLL
ncbi:MAG: hypothetical protein VXY00_03705 [Candidatus Latescibacterota bacterium]|nr:hypothetical protein [Candidatus Latescibacterota bacterium]MEE2725521.1 hypothetical protein [Candidatus Latescibacterota bacterium]